MDVTIARFRISKDIWDNMDYEKVEFVDEFEKKVEEPAEEEAEE
jgi:peptidylprolyl isomerase/FKBP-type peptidyl-prolyl cis-trans isomerase SlyD